MSSRVAALEGEITLLSVENQALKQENPATEQRSGSGREQFQQRILRLEKRLSEVDAQRQEALEKVMCPHSHTEG